jgi:hypothetical protein
MTYIKVTPRCVKQTLDINYEFSTYAYCLTRVSKVETNQRLACTCNPATRLRTPGTVEATPFPNSAAKDTVIQFPSEESIFLLVTVRGEMIVVHTTDTQLRLRTESPIKCIQCMVSPIV